MRKMTKATRIRRMLERGVSTEQIVKATGSSKQYVYTINSQMKKKAREEKWRTIDMTLSATGITPSPAPVDLANKRDKLPPKIRATLETQIVEINKRNKPTLWQRVKAVFGF